MSFWVANPLLCLFAIICLGLVLGSFRIKGISLGTSGVIFSSFIFGMLGLSVPQGVSSIGIVLFVYAVGVGAGPGFFRTFAKQGSRSAQLGLVITATGAITACLFAIVFNLPADLSVGVFAGALTSTPALAAATDAVGNAGAVSVGYGIAYPFGIIGVVLFVQFLPKLLNVNLDKEAQRETSPKSKIVRTLVEIQNPMLFGKRVCDIQLPTQSGFCMSRYLLGEVLLPMKSDITLLQGMNVLLIGEHETINNLIDFFGKPSSKQYFINADTRKQAVITGAEVVGKSLQSLDLLSRFGLTVSRIKRNGVEFVPKPDTVLQYADVITVVGLAENIEQFLPYGGHKERVLSETDLIAVALGIGVGLLVGLTPISLGNGRSFSLGLAGGPLLAGIVMSHFGRLGKIRGYMPAASRMMMMNLGLVFFLSGAGIEAGSKIFSIASSYGVILIAMALTVTIIPMLTGCLFAMKVLKMDILRTLGGICGGMTSTPGLGALTETTESEIPVISYAAAYPISLILMTLFAQLILHVLV